MTKFAIINVCSGRTWWAGEAGSPEEAIRAMAPGCEIEGPEFFVWGDGSDQFGVYELPNNIDLEKIDAYWNEEDIEDAGGDLVGYWFVAPERT